MKGLIKPSNDFENAAIKAFNTISSFANITFEKVQETGNVVGDFRIGIVDKDHFGMASQYAAYSQGVGNSAKSGNIFFNGGKDDDSDNIPDYNEPETYAGMSGALATFLHEILHSLGQKHPFDVIDSTSTTEGDC